MMSRLAPSPESYGGNCAAGILEPMPGSPVDLLLYGEFKKIVGQYVPEQVEFKIQEKDILEHAIRNAGQPIAETKIRTRRDKEIELGAKSLKSFMERIAQTGLAEAVVIESSEQHRRTYLFLPERLPAVFSKPPAEERTQKTKLKADTIRQAALRDKAHQAPTTTTTEIPSNAREAGEFLRANGACNNTDPNLFFPGPYDPQTAKEAKEICDKCGLKGVCLEYALEANEQFGIWGGASERQRKQIRAQRNRAIKAAQDTAAA